MRSKVSSDWLPSYVEATRQVLEIFKMAGYFPDSPHILPAEKTEFANVGKLCQKHFLLLATLLNVYGHSIKFGIYV